MSGSKFFKFPNILRLRKPKQFLKKDQLNFELPIMVPVLKGKESKPAEKCTEYICCYEAEVKEPTDIKDKKGDKGYIV